MTELTQHETKALLSGVILLQQAMIEGLVRHDTIGYPQTRETLEEAIKALEEGEVVDEKVFLPLRETIAMLDDLHRPLELGERPHPVNWPDQLRRLGLI
jgi:hypothetical protein